MDERNHRVRPHPPEIGRPATQREQFGLAPQIDQMLLNERIVRQRAHAIGRDQIDGIAMPFQIPADEDRHALGTAAVERGQEQGDASGHRSESSFRHGRRAGKGRIAIAPVFEQ